MTDETKLNVGQIVYLLAKKEARVYPVLVAEEINKKTLGGSTTSYVVKLPTREETYVGLEKIDAEVFTTIDLARSEMLSRASRQIEMILDKASKITEVFASEMGNVKTDEEDFISEESDDFATVELGNGKVGKIKISDLEQVSGYKNE
jgi:hypothetical protein